MITEAEYNQWKPLIEEYEQYLFQQGTLEALYCTGCQALDKHDCFCDDEEDTDDGYCGLCCGDNHEHFLGCPYNTDPFDNLITNGYD